jgi:U4/U6.U5 tri-snRNP-associated protein 1
MLMRSCTTGDLEGLKVSHDFTEMGEGEARILTLKDSRILDNEGLFRFPVLGASLTCADLEDELQNVEMAEEDRRKKNQELKIKRRDYTGYDDEEFEPGKAGIRRGVLSKYDTVIDGERTTVGR